MARKIRLNVSGSRGTVANTGNKTLRVRAVKRKRVKTISAEAHAPQIAETPTRVHAKQPVLDLVADSEAEPAESEADEPVRPVRQMRTVKPHADQGSDMGLRPAAQAAVPVRPHQPKRIKITKPKLNWS